MKKAANVGMQLRPEDLQLLDYLIARAIDTCIETRRKKSKETGVAA